MPDAIITGEKRMLNPGQFYFSNNKSGFFPKLVRFFTKSKLSHCGIVFFNLGFGAETVIESTTLVQVVPFQRNYRDSKNEEYIVFELIDKTLSRQKIDLDKILIDLFKEYSGQSYGYFQLLWFVFRWFVGLFGFDISNHKNWFTQNVICSEVLFQYLKALKILVLDEKLKKFNSDTVQAQDLFDIVKSCPDIFRVVEFKGIKLNES